MAVKTIGKGKKAPRKEHVIDATDKTLGRLASQIAILLQGKDTADFAPNKIGNNVVLVKNASKIKVSGKKLTDKIYYRHTGYMGHLREETLEEVIAKDPTEALRRAVFNMIPKNFLRQRRMNRLKIEA